MYELDLQQVKTIADKYGSPFYVFDSQLFESNLIKMRSAFERYYDSVLLGYSYKTNYLPQACKIVKSLDGYAEVVSRLEYELALRIGYTSEQIIFNGPLKRKEDLRLALTAGSIVHLDGLSEIETVQSLVHDQLIQVDNIKVGLRVNINLEGEDGISYAQDGLQKGRFGFPGKDIQRAVDALKTMGIEIISLHGHSSSSNRSVENFIRISETLCEVRDKFSLDKLAFFDVGGGFFGEVPKEIIGREIPTFDDYASAISKVMLANDWIRNNKPTLVLEPGVAVSANCLSFYTRIFNQKNVSGKKFLTVDGSIYNVKPTMHSYNLPFRYVAETQIDDNSKPSGDVYDIVGSTCMERDILLKEVALTNPQVADYLEIKNVGAYTIVMTPPFINLAPAIVSVDEEGNFSLSRSEQSVSQFLHNYTI